MRALASPSPLRCFAPSCCWPSPDAADPRQRRGRHGGLPFRQAGRGRRVQRPDSSGEALAEALAEFGPASRYIVRSYPRAGNTWTERILMFHTATYASDVRLCGPIGTEADFLTFARLVEVRAKGKLG